MVKWWHKAHTKKTPIFSEQIYEKKKKKCIGERQVMGKSGQSLRGFEHFPEPVFCLPFLTEGPLDPLKAIQDSSCAVSPQRIILQPIKYSPKL